MKQTEARVFSGLVRAGRLDRRFFTSLMFDERAVGNAVTIIAVLGALMFARPSLLPIIYAALYGVVRGLLSAGAAWAMAVLLFRRSGRFLTTFRLAGFAHVGFVPAAAVSATDTFLPVSLPFAGWWWALSLAASLFWYAAAMRAAADAQFDLTGLPAWLVGAAAAVGWFLAWRLGF